MHWLHCTLIKGVESKAQSDSQSDCETDVEECSIIHLYIMYTMQVISHVSSKAIAHMHVQRRHEPIPMQIDCGNVLLEKYLRPHFKLSKTSKMLHMYSDQVISVREVCKLHLMNP